MVLIAITIFCIYVLKQDLNSVCVLFIHKILNDVCNEQQK